MIRRRCGETPLLCKVFAISLLLAAGHAGAQQPIVVHTFAVKFVCGTLDADGPTARGTYLTTINVHNPNFYPRGIAFRKKVALTYPARQQTPGFVCEYRQDRLASDQALQIDCPDIGSFLPAPPPYSEGFVIIETLGPFLFFMRYGFDVTAVYTARPSGGQVETIHIERYPADLRPRTIPAIALNKTLFTLAQPNLRVGYFGPPNTPVKLLAFQNGNKMFEVVVGRTDSDGVLIQNSAFTREFLGKWKLVAIFEVGGPAGQNEIQSEEVGFDVVQ